jgi:hypothetical protein
MKLVFADSKGRLKTLFPNANVFCHRLSVSHDQRRLYSGSTQARLRLGSGLAQSAQVCSPYLRNTAQSRPISPEIINF